VAWQIIESVGFPWGSSKFRELQQKQERQEDEICALRLLVANFLTGPELEYLRVFASTEPFRLLAGQDSRALFEAVQQLGRLGFVQGKTKLNPAALINADGSDLKTLFEITELGRHAASLFRRGLIWPTRVRVGSVVISECDWADDGLRRRCPQGSVSLPPPSPSAG
jgi:hypothetical protein